MDLGRLLTRAAERAGHLVQRVEIRFEGICQHCQAVSP
jgi:Fe2+ or Zn2+ uptake regulation protein